MEIALRVLREELALAVHRRAELLRKAEENERNGFDGRQERAEAAKFEPAIADLEQALKALGQERCAACVHNLEVASRV